MKIRNGFVSNSSSSSFVCDICGRAEGGYDLSISDIDMYQCVNGHTVCSDEAPLVEEFQKEMNLNYILDVIVRVSSGKGTSDWRKEKCTELLEELSTVNVDNASEVEDFIDKAKDSLNLDDPYEIPACQCPICRLDHVDTYTMLKYLLRKHDEDIVDITKEIQKNFSDESAVFQYVNKK